MQPTAYPPSSVLPGGDVDIQPGMALPLPDDASAVAARDRLTSIDIGVAAPTVTALGMLAEAVVFIAGVQGTAYPRPVLSTRVVLLTGSHAGAVVAGGAPDPRNGVPLQHLAVNAGAGLVTLEWQPAAAPIELEDAITQEQMESALRAGWAEADRAADDGIELLVLAAGGPGSATAAAAVVAAVTGAEPTSLLGRVVTPAGIFDDNAWMTRCVALRDALYRVRGRYGDPRTILTALGGADIAAATGLILGAASRRTPVMIDGPVGAAAALVANDFSPVSRRWVLLPDTGRHMAVRVAAEALRLHPWLDLCLDLGEGAASLAALPMLQTALTLASAGTPVEPGPMSRYDSSGNQIFVGVAKPIEPSPTAEQALHVVADEADEADAATEPATGERGKRRSASTTVVPDGAVTETTRDTAVRAAAASAAPSPTSAPAPADADAAKPPAPADAATKGAKPPVKDAAKESATKEPAAKEPAAKEPAAKDGPAKATPAKDADTGQKQPAAAPAPRAPETKTADTKTADTKTADTKTADTTAPEPRQPEPRQPEPKQPEAPATAAKVLAPKDGPAKVAAPAAKAGPAPATDEPARPPAAKVAEPKVAEVAEPKVAEPKVAEPKVAEPAKPPVKAAPAKAAPPPMKAAPAKTVPTRAGGKVGDDVTTRISIARDPVKAADVADREAAAREIARQEAARREGTAREALTRQAAAKEALAKQTAKDGASKDGATKDAGKDGVAPAREATATAPPVDESDDDEPGEAVVGAPGGSAAPPRPRKRP